MSRRCTEKRVSVIRECDGLGCEVHAVAVKDSPEDAELSGQWFELTIQTENDAAFGDAVVTHALCPLCATKLKRAVRTLYEKP